MTLGLVDSHCHIQQLPADERQRALDEARDRGVDGFLVPALHLAEIDTLVDLAESNADLWIALGVHPHEARRWSEGDAKRLRAHLDHDRVIAVGECGLDFFYDHSPRDQQLLAMREQWEVAVDAGLPVVVHNRDSDRAMLEIFRQPEFGSLGGVFHSYCAGAAMAHELLERQGIWLGISGMVTFRGADNVREVLAFTPAERLLVETDTPYLAPVPHRGQPNRPAYVVEVAARVAQELSLPVDEVCRRTGAGFQRLFERVVPPARGSV